MTRRQPSRLRRRGRPEALRHRAGRAALLAAGRGVRLAALEVARLAVQRLAHLAVQRLAHLAVQRLAHLAVRGRRVRLVLRRPAGLLAGRERRRWRAGHRLPRRRSRR